MTVTASPASRSSIVAHVERHLGPVKQVFGDASIATEPTAELPVDVLHVAATLERPVHTLVTCGMSDHAMAVPQGTDSPRYLELMMTLPREWKLDVHAPHEQTWYWPIRQLQYLSGLPRKAHQWMGWGHTFPNGDPPQPLAPNTRLCGSILVPSLLVPTPFYELALADRTVAFYSVVPLYKEELALKDRNGMAALFEKLLDRGIRDLVDIKRRNVANKRFGLF